PFLARALHDALPIFANYARFVRKILTRDYALLHFNPSLNRNSFYRDGVFLLLARLCGAPRLVFFRGWEEPFAEQIGERRVLRARSEEHTAELQSREK